jgi:predicted ATP-grasp superfamily ATP-dependent carboligase
MASPQEFLNPGQAGSSRGVRGCEVLALGTGVTLLGVLRILGRDGARVMALPDVRDFARRSRWFRSGPEALAGVTPASLATVLPALSPGTVLLPCSDAWVRAVARLPAELRERYPASIAPAAALDILVDKTEFGAALERLGLPHPMTRPVRVTADLDQVPDAVLSSSFLKPADSQRFFARFQVKAFQIAGRQEAADRLAACAAEGLAMVLQEYVPGPPTSHYFVDGFVDRTGTVRALFARRRLRMFPPDFGNSTLMRSVPVAEVGDTPATLRALFAAIGYRGIFSAEFKRDARDGRFKVLEINARPWWYVGFAASCGVDVCAMAVLDALGQPVGTVEQYAVGRRCVYPYYDYDAVKAERAAGRLGVSGWLGSWIGATQPVFRWSDPLPAWGEIAGMIRRRILR